MSDRISTDNLVVLTFAGSGTAAAYEQIMDMDARGQVRIKDAAIDERGEDTEQGASVAMPVRSGQTAGGAPVSGPSMPMCASSRRTAKRAGMRRIKAQLLPDSSALLLLGRAEDRDLFADKLRTFEPQLFSTTLPPELEEQLRDRLAGAA